MIGLIVYLLIGFALSSLVVYFFRKDEDFKDEGDFIFWSSIAWPIFIMLITLYGLIYLPINFVSKKPLEKWVKYLKNKK